MLEKCYGIAISMAKTSEFVIRMLLFQAFEPHSWNVLVLRSYALVLNFLQSQPQNVPVFMGLWDAPGFCSRITRESP